VFVVSGRKRKGNSQLRFRPPPDAAVVAELPPSIFGRWWVGGPRPGNVFAVFHPHSDDDDDRSTITSVFDMRKALWQYYLTLVRSEEAPLLC
jgi:hypothetical protein